METRELMRIQSMTTSQRPLQRGLHASVQCRAALPFPDESSARTQRTAAPRHSARAAHLRFVREMGSARPSNAFAWAGPILIGLAVLGASGCGDDGSATDPLVDASVDVGARRSDGAIDEDGFVRGDAEHLPDSQTDSQTDAGQVDAEVMDSFYCDEGGASEGVCVCGCGRPDPDCPVPTTLGDCDQHGCTNPAERPDPADLTRCAVPVLPTGWSCGVDEYLDDIAYVASERVTRPLCTCGCGGLDDLGCAMAPADHGDCENDGCADGFGPDPADLSRCIALPTGWTCSSAAYYDDTCHCGCGRVDPACPADARFTDCRRDGCSGNEGPNPLDLAQCIANAPQDSWSCDLDTLADGAACDCGCGAIDPDCPAGATVTDCDVVHCRSRQELTPGGVSSCREVCEPSSTPSGSATCTNGGMFSVGAACTRTLSRCDDGNRYEMECSGY